MQIFSFSPFGYEGSLVAVEVDLRRGIPSVDLVGLADGAVKESRERMRSAIRNSGYDFPLERVLISLSPADLKKEGAGFDLALALAVLYENSRANKGCGQNCEVSEPVLIMGELELSGSIRAVKAVHAAAATAAGAGIKKCIVPLANVAEAREVAGIKAFGASTLTEAFESLQHPECFSGIGEDTEQAFVPEGSVKIESVLFPPEEPELDFIHVKNQGKLVRALQVAAAGGHNLLAYGPPGCGKTLSLCRFRGLLPLLTVEESRATTRIYSIAGLMPANQSLVRIAPFRMPHQTASIEGICGGGVNCRPGEVSLAHNGVLFLDEAAEFKTSVLQMLRVPLESRTISLSRAGRSTVYPADFQLLLATNPCPCGNFGAPDRMCLCSARSVEMYWRKFNGPLLDRIDIRVAVTSSVESEENEKPVSTAELRKAIARAVCIQRKRQGVRNSHLLPQDILRFCSLGKSEQLMFDESVKKNDFSQRAVSGILRLARTIADMEQSEKIKEHHLAEALELRNNSGPLSLFSAS